MTITTLSSCELDQDVSRAKKAAELGPVFITDCGKPAHVLLSIEEYQRLTRGKRNIADALAMPGVADIEFEPFPERGIALLDALDDFDEEFVAAMEADRREQPPAQDRDEL